MELSVDSFPQTLILMGVMSRTVDADIYRVFVFSRSFGDVVS